MIHPYALRLRHLRRGPRSLARPVRPGHPVAASSTRPTSRAASCAARSGTCSPPAGRLDDERRIPGGPRTRSGAPGFHDAVRGRARPFDHVGHHHRGSARRDQPGRAGPGNTDADGIAGAARSSTGCRENTRRLLDFHVARARESLLAAGASDVVVAPLIRDTGWHLLGTARMGTTRRRRSSTPRAAPTTSRTSTSSTAASSRRPPA